MWDVVGLARSRRDYPRATRYSEIERDSWETIFQRATLSNAVGKKSARVVLRASLSSGEKRGHGERLAEAPGMDT